MVSDQWSVISGQFSVISDQLSVGRFSVGRGCVWEGEAPAEPTGGAAVGRLVLWGVVRGRGEGGILNQGRTRKTRKNESGIGGDFKPRMTRMGVMLGRGFVSGQWGVGGRVVGMGRRRAVH